MDKNAADVLKQIADKLDVPVEALWSGLIAYAPFTFWQWAVGIGVGLLLAILCGLMSYWCVVRKESEGPVFFAMLGIALLALTFGIGISSMPEALAAKTAPQAWAAKQIINKLGR